MRKALRIKGWKKNKIVIHRYKVGNVWKEVRLRVLGPKIYTYIEGGEKDLIHFCFNKAIIKKEFRNFKIPKIWVRKGHYCFVGELKK